MITQSHCFDDSERLVGVRADDASGTIVLQRANKKNALSREMLGQLREAFADLHQVKKVRAVILTGAGDCFCAGVDLTEIGAALGGDETRVQESQMQWYADSAAQKELIETMLRFPKPIIAALNGPALGFGAALVLASDYTVATAEASFGFPETRRGLVAGLAAPLLSFRVGAAAAADLLLRGSIASADECIRLGIYRAVVDQQLAWAKADAVAKEFTATAAEAVSMTKRLLNETIGEQVITHLAAGAATTAAARTTEAAAEGVSAFLEKRSPQWP